MIINDQLLFYSGSTYPPIFIVAVGFIMYRFVYTETIKILKGEAANRGKWVAFFLAQGVIGFVVIGEFGNDTFLPTLAAAVLEYLACFIARVIAKRTKA